MFLKDAGKTEQEELLLLSRAVEEAKTGIVITDPRRQDNPIIYANPAFVRITGYETNEILGRNCRFLQKDDNEQVGLSEVRTAMYEHNAVTTVIRNYRKDGTLFYNELTISPVRDLGGELIAHIGVQNDITLRLEAENRVTDFYAVVSHELRTPIAKIMSSLSLIIDGDAGPVSKTVSRFVSISMNAADSLWKLVENILDFRKLEIGEFRLSLKSIPIADLIEHAISDFRPVVAKASMTIACEQDVRPIVRVDGERIVQVLDNLLTNAVKYSSPNSHITVSVKDGHDDSVRICVQDQGIGIAESELPKLFKPFQQVQSPDRRSRGGTGLGLNICKGIIEAHGGKIGFESTKGVGSTFWFDLPLSNSNGT